jgi:methionyl-tRNA formyltransferase
VRLVFLGTAAFAVPSLHACAERHDVVAVVTQPAKPGSRGRPAPRPVGEAAAALRLPVLTPGRIRDAEAVAEILDFEPECLVVAAYGQILPAALLEWPDHGAINVHASLLPRWRGAAPVAHAILAGDAEAGVSIMRMDEGLDTGPVYAQRGEPVHPDDTTPALTARLADLGATLLIETLDAVARGEAVATPQPESGVTPAPRLRRQDGEVSWVAFTAVEIDRRVRALQPWPGVNAPLAGVSVRIMKGGVEAGQGVPGEVVRAEGDAVTVAARVGLYRVEQVLPPGSRAMSATAFLRGRRTSGGAP